MQKNCDIHNDGLSADVAFVIKLFLLCEVEKDVVGVLGGINGGEQFTGDLWSLCDLVLWSSAENLQ